MGPPNLFLQLKKIKPGVFWWQLSIGDVHYSLGSKWRGPGVSCPPVSLQGPWEKSPREGGQQLVSANVQYYRHWAGAEQTYDVGSAPPAGALGGGCASPPFLWWADRDSEGSDYRTRCWTVAAPGFPNPHRRGQCVYVLLPLVYVTAHLHPSLNRGHRPGLTFPSFLRWGCLSQRRRSSENVFQTSGEEASLIWFLKVSNIKRFLTYAFLNVQVIIWIYQISQSSFSRSSTPLLILGRRNTKETIQRRRT